MFRIRRFGVVRTANLAAAMYFLVIAIVFVPIAALVAAIAPNSSAAPFGAVGGVAVFFLGLLLALFYAVVGWVFTALACLLYNLVAGLTGGIEIQLETVEPPPPVVGWTAPGPVPEPPPGNAPTA